MSTCVSRCVSKRRVCLSNASEYPCRQYECVGRPVGCDKSQLDPMCDTDGVVHANLCQLHQSGKTLAYVGQCQVQNSKARLQCRPPETPPAAAAAAAAACCCRCCCCCCCCCCCYHSLVTIINIGNRFLIRFLTLIELGLGRFLSF